MKRILMISCWLIAACGGSVEEPKNFESTEEIRTATTEAVKQEKTTKPDFYWTLEEAKDEYGQLLTTIGFVWKEVNYIVDTVDVIITPCKGDDGYPACDTVDLPTGQVLGLCSGFAAGVAYRGYIENKKDELIYWRSIYSLDVNMSEAMHKKVSAFKVIKKIPS